MSIIIPSQSTKSWKQENTGELLGTLFGTKNISFDQKGYLKLSRRSMALIYNQANFGDLKSICTLDGNTYLAVTSLYLWSFTLTSPTLTSQNNAGSNHVGSQYADGVVWQKKWYVSQTTGFTDFDGTNWSGTIHGSFSNATAYHPLCVHEGLNYLACGEDNTVKLYDNSYNLVLTITIPTNFQVRWIRYNNNNLYIGTKNISGGDAELFIADGTSVFPSAGIRTPSIPWLFSGDIFEGVIVVMGSNGQLLRFNSTGFDELAHLPVYDNPQYNWYDGSGSVEGKVQQRGMTVKGKRIYINLDGSVNNSDGDQLPNQPSGLWIYEAEIGLYHRAGYSLDNIIGIQNSTGVNTTTNVITTATTIPKTTGTKIYVYTTDCTGLMQTTFYYLIWLSSTTYKLASTYNNAINGVAIALGTGTQVNIYANNNLSFGETLNTSCKPGAICLINDLNTSLTGYHGSIVSQVLFGATVDSYTSATGIPTIQSLTTGENRGSFITVKIPASKIKNTWNYVYSKYGYLFQGNDAVVAKYRTKDMENYPLYISAGFIWVTSTSFTCTGDLSSVQKGYEIEFTAGRGAGCTAHVTSLSVNAGTWTVNIDEAIPSVTAGDFTWTAIIQNWTKVNITTIASATFNDGFTKIPIENVSKWVQFKVELRGISEPYIEELQLAFAEQTPSV